MKPTDWADLTPDERHSYARGLLNSTRGWYLMSQALHYAISTMKAVPSPHTEISNIEDLEVLRETLFDCPIADGPMA